MLLQISQTIPKSFGSIWTSTPKEKTAISGSKHQRIPIGQSLEGKHRRITSTNHRRPRSTYTCRIRKLEEHPISTKLRASRASKYVKTWTRPHHPRASHPTRAGKEMLKHHRTHEYKALTSNASKCVRTPGVPHARGSKIMQRKSAQTHHSINSPRNSSRE